VGPAQIAFGWLGVGAPALLAQRAVGLDQTLRAIDRRHVPIVGRRRVSCVACVGQRGGFRIGGRLQLMPCDGAPLTLEDRTPHQEPTRALRELTTGNQGRPMFVELYGSREVGLGAGIAALELRRAAVETAGCRERFDHREWIGLGNDPSWRLEVTSRDMVIGLLGGPPTLRVTHGGPERPVEENVQPAAPLVTVTCSVPICWPRRKMLSVAVPDGSAWALMAAVCAPLIVSTTTATLR